MLHMLHHVCTMYHAPPCSTAINLKYIPLKHRSLINAHKCFPGGSDGKRIHLQCRRPGFNPWVRKIPWRRKWQPTPVLLPGKPPRTEEPGGRQSMGLQRVGHDWATKQLQQWSQGPLLKFWSVLMYFIFSYSSTENQSPCGQNLLSLIALAS